MMCLSLWANIGKYPKIENVKWHLKWIVLSYMHCNINNLYLPDRHRAQITHTQTHIVLINSNCLKRYPFPCAVVRISKIKIDLKLTFNFIIVDAVRFQTIPCQTIQFHIWNDLKVFYENLKLKMKNSIQNSKSQTKITKPEI